VQAEFLAYCVGELAQDYASLMGETPSEPDLRSYARVLDRIADRTGVPAAMVGYLVLQKRGGQAG
jgi:hypothetical protein